MNPKKILLACLENVPGVNPPEFSIEYLNFYLPLTDLNNAQVKFFALDKINVVGGHQVSLEIKNILKKEKFDLLVIVSFNHNLDKKVFQEIRDEKLAKTVAIFFDEDTDLYQRSLAWAPYLDWLITFYPPAYEEYKRRRYDVLGVDWFVNTKLYKPLANYGDPSADVHQPQDDINISIKDIDVSFIGSAKPERKRLAEKIRRAGIDIQTWGVGWPNGPVNIQQMVDIFQRSKINLNLGMGKSIWRWQTPFRIFFSPARNKLGFKLDLINVVGNWKTILNRRRPQCRARLFEIMACGAFALTNGNAPLFGDFTDGEDIAFYKNENDLIEKIKYYLQHENLREKIAQNSYEKFLKNNSANICLGKILKNINENNK